MLDADGRLLVAEDRLALRGRACRSAPRFLHFQPHLDRIDSMFSSKKQPAIRSLIGEGTVIQGTLSFSGGLRIDGEVQGDVVADAGSTSILVISEKARSPARSRPVASSSMALLSGRSSPACCSSCSPKAHIQGDVVYEALEMHQGATIEGALHPLSGRPRRCRDDRRQACSQAGPPAATRTDHRPSLPPEP